MNLPLPVASMWYVHVWVRGHYSGYYEFPTREAAMADYADRIRCFRCLGCGYAVSNAPEGIVTQSQYFPEREGERC